MSKKSEMKKKEPKTNIDASLIEEALHSIEKVSQGKKEAKAEGALSGNEVSSSGHDDDTYQRLVRLTADFDNFRKRVQKEKNELVLSANEYLVKELLPVLDNFERAMSHAGSEGSAESLRDGVNLILSQLTGILDRFGVHSESALGKEFDPLVHEAMSQQPSDEYPAQTVMQEHQKAYFLHKKLIRPAMVIVSTGPTEATGEAGESSESAQKENGQEE